MKGEIEMKQFTVTLSVLLVLGVALCGCVNPTASPTPQIVTIVASPTPTSTMAPTSTPIPKPTIEPTPMPTGVFVPGYSIPGVALTEIEAPDWITCTFWGADEWHCYLFRGKEYEYELELHTDKEICSKVAFERDFVLVESDSLIHFQFGDLIGLWGKNTDKVFMTITPEGPTFFAYSDYIWPVRQIYNQQAVWLSIPLICGDTCDSYTNTNGELVVQAPPLEIPNQ